MKKYGNIHQHFAVLASPGKWDYVPILPYYEHTHFHRKICNFVIMHLFTTLSYFDGNKDFKSSKALKWVLIYSSFYSKVVVFFPIKNFLTSSPENKIPFKEALIMAGLSNILFPRRCMLNMMMVDILPFLQLMAD